MLSFFEIVSLLLALSAFFGWLNYCYLKLPHTIGMLMIALATSFLILITQYFFPELKISQTMISSLDSIDFQDAVMKGMLGFILFAGALHVDFDLLRSQKWAIALMASLGVVISTAIIGVGFWLLCNFLGFELPLIWALVFGVLISPTDPVAVLSLLKSIKVPKALEAKIAGESLFNDGVAVVLFGILLSVGEHGADADLSIQHISDLFLFEACGGAAFGYITGWIGRRALATIDEYSIEVLISIGVVAATYAIASHFHLSGPIAVVMVGLLIGNSADKVGKSKKASEHLRNFWHMIDEILNSILFLLIGLEILVLKIDPIFGVLAIAAIPLVLFGRFISVSIPILGLSFKQTFSAGSIPVLTWGGLRGGVSVALTLSIVDNDYTHLILTTTYVVVIFSIIVQGLTVKHVVSKTVDSKLL